MFWLLAYVAGLLVALALFRERFPLRLLLAASWPLAPLSLVLTVLLLLAVLPFARPAAGLIVWLVLGTTGVMVWHFLTR